MSWSLIVFEYVSKKSNMNIFRSRIPTTDTRYTTVLCGARSEEMKIPSRKTRLISGMNIMRSQFFSGISRCLGFRYSAIYIANQKQNIFEQARLI